MNKLVKKSKYILLIGSLFIISIYNFYINIRKEENSQNSSQVIFFIQIILTTILSFNFLKYFSNSNHINYKFKYWNLNAESLKSIIKYVNDVSSEESKNYIPKEDRIALFDFDGTIYGEKGPLYIEYYMYYDFLKNNPKYLEIEPHKSIYRRLEKSCKEKKLIDFELEYDAIESEAKIYKGYTIEEHQNFVKKFAENNAKCFKNLKFRDMFYLPMVEIVEYLQLNNFTVYVVSASDRFLIREYLKFHFKIPEQNVIATDVELMPKSEEENFNKTGKIAREIGKKPVLSFGNSNSDVALQNYVLNRNKYKSEAYMVVADDIKREYGVDKYDSKGNLDTTKSDEIKRKWKSKEYGYKVISMRDDFKTIYGENVTLTNYEE